MRLCWLNRTVLFLTQARRRPIVGSVTVQEQLSTDVPEKQVKTIDVYDFRRPTTLARKHARVLELAFETFARQWGTRLTARVRVMSQLTSEHVVMQTYAEYTEGLPSMTAMVLCAVENTTAKAVIQFPTSAALSWVVHMLGGHGNQPIPDRKFTQIEQSLLRRLMDDALDDLHYSLGQLLTNELEVDTTRYNSQAAQATGPNDLMVVGTFTIRVGENTSTATVAIPAEVLLPQLGEANPMSTTTNAKELVSAQLTQVPVDVSLQFSPVRVKPGAILNLAVGDVIHLPHPQHRPLDVAVNGQRLAQAAVGANGSRAAGVIVNTEEISR